jgi:hypothetical protein
MNVKEKIWDISLVVNDIKKFPQTYETILKEEVNNGTCQTILRRKLNKLIKQGIICKTSIPGTRFGKAIIYILPKEYSILVEAGRLGSNVYVFFDYEQISEYYIKVNKYWILKKTEWIEKEEKVFFEGNVLKWL